MDTLTTPQREAAAIADQSLSHAIGKGRRVRVIATGKTGVIAAQKPDDEPYGNPPQRPVRRPLRFRVYDFDNQIDHGWFWWFELEPYTRQPEDTPEHVRKAAQIGARLLLAHRQEGGAR